MVDLTSKADDLDQKDGVIITSIEPPIPTPPSTPPPSVSVPPVSTSASQPPVTDQPSSPPPPASPSSPIPTPPSTSEPPLLPSSPPPPLVQPSPPPLLASEESFSAEEAPAPIVITEEELPKEPSLPTEEPPLPSAPISPPPTEEELTIIPRVSTEPPQPPSPTSPSVEAPAEKPEESPPPPTPEVNITPPRSPLSRLLPLLFILLVLGALAFSFWKFALPLLPSIIKPGGITLTYWGLWEDENILKPLFEEYSKSHRGVKINYVKQSPTEYRERLQTALSQGKGPDIFRFHNTWVPMLKTELSPVPSSVFNPGDFQKTFYPVAVNDLVSGGTIYGLPLEIDGLALLYNDDIFKGAGVSPPTGWNELQKAAIKLTVKDTQQRIQTAGIALGTTNNIDNWSDVLAEMFLQNGADLKNPQGKSAEDAMFFYTSFAQGGNKTWDETLPPSTLAFAQGKAAMIFAPSWQIINIKAKNPQLNFKVLPLPQLPGINVTWASYWVEGVAAKSPRQAEAWEFLKYLSQKETLVKLYTEASKTRLFGEPYSRQDLAQSLKDDPYVGPYIQQAPCAQSFYLSSKTFDNGINEKMIKYLEDAVNSVNRGVSPRSALETATAGFKQVLATYGVPYTPPLPIKCPSAM